MKAIQYSSFGSADVLRLVDLPRPRPAGEAVVIEVHAAGVNFVDVRQRQGAYNRVETRVGGIDLPSIPGMQAVGTVVELGPDADRSLMNRKVVAAVTMGAYAEFVSAPSSMCVPVPDDANDAMLAVLPTQGLTAYFMLTASTVLRPGESVLVHAAGSGVGNLAVQIAKIPGAGTVIATAGTEEKRAFALQSGADAAVDYSKADWTKAVLDATDGRGVDVLLESVSGEIFEQNFECLATFGRYILYGSTRGLGKPLECRRLMTKAQSIAGFYLPVFFARPDLVREGLRFMVEQLTKGSLRGLIAAEWPLERAPKPNRRLKTGRSSAQLSCDRKPAIAGAHRMKTPVAVSRAGCAATGPFSWRSG